MLKCSIIRHMMEIQSVYLKKIILGLCASILTGLLLGPTTLSALPVTGLYSYRIEVANESDSERARAFREALAAVIVKVTGDERWLLDPAVVSAIGRAQSYVEAVGYESETIEVPVEVAQVPSPVEQADNLAGAEPVDPDATTPIDSPEIPQTQVIEQRFINVNFSRALINELLGQANIPIWGSNRPSVLVWMVLQNEIGERAFLSSDTNPELVALIQDFAARRGLPVIFPLFDFEDRRNLPIDAIWALDLETMRSGSARYGADSILTGRLHFTAGGELVGLWQFDFQGNAERFDGFDTDLKQYLTEPLARVTTQLANYFAIVPENNSSQEFVLRIEGVQDLQDYSALMSYVSGLGLVDGVTIASMDGQRMELKVSVLGDALQLSELIALDRDLLPIESSQVASSSMLHFRWTR